MKRTKRLLPALMLGLAVGASFGCSRQDPTLEAAPPPGANARALPNAGGQKPSVAGATLEGGGGGQRMEESGTQKPLTKPPGE